MKESEKNSSSYEREVRKRRFILEILILIFAVLLGIMVIGLTNSLIKAYKNSKITPTPIPTFFPRLTRTPTPTPTPTNTPTPTPGPVIMIDPGHGGYDVGTDGGGVADVYEKTLNLSIGLKLRTKLTELGFTVVMTRDEDVDVSLEDRLKMANESEANVFISLHANGYNSGDGDASGCEVYYNSKKNENSSLLAECLVNDISDKTGLRNRNTKIDNTLMVLKTVKPAVLVEYGFITSENDYPLLKDEKFQDLIVQGIADGLLKYYKNVNGVN